MKPVGDWSAEDRAALRRVLRAHYPFVTATEWGPAAVAAGECDRCGEEPRMVQPCGPPPDDLPAPATPDWALGRDCAAAVGPAGWCDGHTEEAEEALDWLARLPDDADDVARLWWIATGEVRPDPLLLPRARALLTEG